MRWPWSRAPEPPANTSLSIADPLLVQYFTPGGLVDLAGVVVGETSALGLSALYRALNLIAGTLASLPLNTWTGQETERRKVPSVFDDPDGPDQQTVYEWKESVFLHLLLHGRAGALKVRNEAGGLVRLPLVHPLAFQVVQPTVDEFQSGKLPAGGVWFEVSLNDGERVRLDADDFWYVPGPSLGYQVGISLLAYARQSLGTAIAGDKAAAKTFSSGALISGLATPSDEGFDLTEDIPQIRQELNRSVLGHENAGTIALVNRRLQFTPWTMTAQQAQFLESRQFQIEEISRWTGVPPHLLMQTDKQTSWGTGVDEQNRGLSKFVLGHWAQRFEQRASRLLARPRWCEFDFAGLERPNFAVEIDLLIKQVQAGLLTVNEAREIRNLPPLPDAPPDVEKPDDEGAGDEPPPE
jgi:HK97 family phage portal protein